MYICPPAKEVYVYNNYNFVPMTMGGIRARPNYDEKFKSNATIEEVVNDFMISRM